MSSPEREFTEEELRAIEAKMERLTADDVLLQTLVTLINLGARKAAVSRESSDPVGDCRTAVLSAAYNLDMTQSGASVSCQYDSSMTPGTTVQVEVDYPYSIDLFGIPVASGQLKSVMKERLE